MGHRAWQIPERVLRALAPAFAKQAAGADGNEGLIDIVGMVAHLAARFGLLRGGGVHSRKIAPEINEQPALLIFLQFDLPLRRRE